ncbi:MAG: FMN-binding protein [Treponema sp.]|jgi:uncharacterized protein with FMN-binding domain|nr:FMN-binding protein [Treponema sp.]
MRKIHGVITVLAGALLAALLLPGCADPYGKPDGGDDPEDTAVYRKGEYTGSAESVGGPLRVTVGFSSQAIESVAVTAHNDTASRPEVERALETIPRAIVASQSAEVDVIAGATITSRRIMDAVEACIAQAEILGKKPPANDPGETPGEARSILETMEGVWYSYSGGRKTDGYRIGKWKDRHTLLPQAKRDLFPGFDIDAPKFRNYRGMVYNAANDYPGALDDACFIFYDDTVYESQPGDGGHGGWGDTRYRYIGIAKSVNTFTGKAGAVIIQYLDKCYPNWDADFAGIPPLSYFGVYYRVVDQDSIQMANAVDLDNLGAGQKYYTETATLEEAIAKNTAENGEKFISWGVVLPQEREK